MPFWAILIDDEKMSKNGQKSKNPTQLLEIPFSGVEKWPKN